MISDIKITHDKIKQASFAIEYIYLAYISILIIRQINPNSTDFGFYFPFVVSIVLALLYSVVMYFYSGKSTKPSWIEIIVRLVYLLLAGYLMSDIRNLSVQIIIVLPTIVVALRYSRKYTVIMALATSIVIVLSVVRYSFMEYDNLFIFVSFVWLIGLLVNVFMETERRVQRELQKILEKEKLAAIGEMAAGIAHEVRNPLTTIKGFVQLLDRFNKVKEPDTLKKYLSMIDKEIDRVNDLASVFLQFARPRKPQLTYRNLNNTILDLNIILRSHCNNKKVQLEIEYSTNLPDILCDEDQIKQVIINMALNAIDAMQDSPVKLLKIKTDFNSDYVCIKISDTGCGISSDQLDKIFLPFFTNKDSGTGLGLSMCNSIIENHKGRIEVESTFGKGTTFRILLPRRYDN